MKSALFVDFDNVFTQLRQLDEGAADRFARNPSAWLHWLVDGLPLPEPHAVEEKRRLLVRRCYLNPNWYQGFRHAFLRAGFEVVDCPPVTSQGKTSTDIHMVLDVVELLQHETRYDEFIVFSADADFTPVLRKLRRFDRRTTVLAIGYPSAAYQASADLLIDERRFIGEVLADKATPSPADPEPPKATAAPDRAGEPAPQRLMTEAELAAAAETILKCVADAPRFVVGSLLASRIKQDYPFLMNWNGEGNFKSFLKALQIARLVWFSASGGKLLDPATQPVPKELALDADSPWAGQQDMFELMAGVCASTGTPMFAPAQLSVVLMCMAEDLAEHPFELAKTAERVVDRCKAGAGLRVRRRDITFLLRGMLLSGHVFGQGSDGLPTLKEQLARQVLFLCEREQMQLGESSTRIVRQWIGSVGAT